MTTLALAGVLLVVVLAAGAVAIQQARVAARRKEELDDLRRQREALEAQNKIETGLATASRDDLERMRERWQSHLLPSGEAHSDRPVGSPSARDIKINPDP